MKLLNYILPIICICILSLFITSCFNIRRMNLEKEDVKTGIWYEVLSDSIVVKTRYKNGIPFGKQILVYPNGKKLIYEYKDGVKTPGYYLITKEGEKSLVISSPPF